MSELKTLKDCERIETYEGDHFVDVYELKAEAVKWVKFQENLLSLGRKIKENMKDYQFNIEWIKHFFNLTEEDLK